MIQAPVRRGNLLGAARDTSQFGWIGPVFTQLGNNRRWAASLVKGNAIVVDQAFPLETIHNTPMDLLAACRIAVAGNGVKTFTQAQPGAGPADVLLNLNTGTPVVFGVKVRITDSPLNFKFGALVIELQTSAGVVVNRVAIQANRLPAELVMLATSIVGGKMSVIGLTSPKVNFPAAGSSLVASSTQCYAETLNMRDIGHINHLGR